MSHADAEMADILIVVDDAKGVTLEQAVELVKELGASVAEVNQDEWTIEATVEADKVNDIKKLPFVDYLRLLYEYIADFPKGDGRDLDGDETEDE